MSKSGEMTDISRPEQIQQAFDAIQAAKLKNRRVVLLLGSGVSIDAGIPPAIGLVTHLVHVWRLMKDDGWTDPRAYLQRFGWPSRHDAAARWLLRQEQRWREDYGEDMTASQLDAQFERDRAELYEEALTDEVRRAAPLAAPLVKKAVRAQLSPKNVGSNSTPDTSKSPDGEPTYTDYRSLLNYITSYDTNLIDAYFDHFVRQRDVATIHQFISFAIQALNVRLVLTTNFDTLLETALRDEGLTPTVYEVTREGDVPGSVLVRAQRLSVVKLHGGPYALRTSFDLDDRMPISSLTEIREYLAADPDSNGPPLLVVVGYSGSDRRVMDIVTDHIGRNSEIAPFAGDRETSKWRLVWVSFDGKLPPVLGGSKPHPSIKNRVLVCPYRSGRFFFQELLQRISGQHPVSDTNYQLLNPIPRQSGKPSEPPAEIHWLAGPRGSLTKKPLGRFALCYCNEAGMGTSNELAREVDTLARDHHLIWIDAGQVCSRASMFVVIEEALRRQDRNLLPITRPFLIDDVDYLVGEGKAAVRGPTHEMEKEYALRWIVTALRRGRYVLAIDSIGEFGTTHPALREKPNSQRVRDLINFLNGLRSRQHELGQSKIRLAVTKNALLPQLSAEALASLIFATPTHDVFHEFVRRRTPDETASETTATLDGRSLAPDISRSVKKAFAAIVKLKHKPPSALRKEEVGKHKAAQSLVPLLLALGSFLRRPRSVIEMRVLVVHVYASFAVRGLFKHFKQCLEPMRKLLPVTPPKKKPADWEVIAEESVTTDQSSRELLFDVVDISLRYACRTAAHDPLIAFHAQEGGFFAMHPNSRRDVYDTVTDGPAGSTWTFTELERSMIFDWLANFSHEDLFERCQDSSAFLEYLFYRECSIHTAEDREDAGTRLEQIVATIQREKEKMLARGRLMAVLNHVRSIIRTLVEEHAGPLADVSHELRGRLLLQLIKCYADMLVACGHPWFAIRYYFWQAQLICSRSTKAPRAKTADKSLFAAPEIGETRPAELAARIICDGQDLRDRLKPLIAKLDEIDRIDVATLHIDIASALSDSLVFFDKPLDGLEGASPVDWTLGSERDRRYTLAKESLETCNRILDAKRCPSFEASQVRHRAEIRLVEHQLRQYGNYRFGSPPNDPPAEYAAGLRAKATAILQEARVGPPTSRRRRHKSYVYLALARWQWMAYKRFEHARVLFARAEASVSRQGGAAENSARAMIALFQAEARLCEADVLRQDGERNRVVAEAIGNLMHETDVLLHQADALLQIGRIENRWRVFFYMLRTRSYLFRIKQINDNRKAETAPSDNDYGAMITHYARRAMHSCIGGLINTGLNSDRHLIADYFRKRLGILLGRVLPPSDTKEPDRVKAVQRFMEGTPDQAWRLLGELKDEPWLDVKD